MTTTQAILVVEDQPATAEWLAGLIRHHFPSAAVEVRDSVAASLEWLAAQVDAPLLALVDLGLPDGSGIAFVEALVGRFPAAQAVVTTVFDDDPSLLQAMAAGAAGYILKDQEPELIGERIAGIKRGEVPMSPAISRRILAHFQADVRSRVPATSVKLTPRELDVLRLIGRGLRVAEAARVLDISSLTIAGYIKSIYRKLDIGSRAEAAIEASRRGLL